MTAGGAETLAGGRYRLGRLLGTGGMASVRLAHDEELDRPVAIKLLAEGLAHDEAFRARFVREATLAARLSHRNVVAVFDTGEDEGRPFIVMEYVESETLADVVQRRGRLPLDEALPLVLQAAAGLEHAHAAGLVHRDVKPGNLLLCADGTLKVADFGIARAAELSQLTDIGTVLGTAAYVSPEQVAGEAVTPATDVYALGVVVYELLTGSTPYRVDSLRDLAQRDEPPAPLRLLAPEVPSSVEAAVERALQRRPADRQHSAAEFAAELSGGAPQAPTAVTRPLQARRPPSRPVGRVWAIAAAVLVLGLGVAGALWAGSGEEPPPATPPEVEPIPPGATPEEAARNLADWLRQNAG